MSDDKRSDFPCPMVRRTDMPAIKSMADGKTYDNRDDYYKHLKDSGHRILEKGEY